MLPSVCIKTVGVRFEHDGWRRTKRNGDRFALGNTYEVLLSLGFEEVFGVALGVAVQRISVTSAAHLVRLGAGAVFLQPAVERSFANA
jgi:hypothetical protein